jgi:hypothetical protein
LCDLVDARFFGDVGGSRWPGEEVVRLGAHLGLFGAAGFVLLSKEICQVHFDACWGAGSEVIGRDLVLGFLEFYQLCLDHLNLLFFAFSLDAELLLLHGR